MQDETAATSDDEPQTDTKVETPGGTTVEESTPAAPDEEGTSGEEAADEPEPEQPIGEDPEHAEIPPK